MIDKFLEDDKIKLRAPEPGDVDRMFSWENDTKEWDNGCVVAPYSRLQIWEYIQNYEADIFKSRQLKFVVVDKMSGINVGMVDVFDFDPINKRASVGIYIDEDYRKQGMATRSVTLLLTYCKEFIGMHQLSCIISVDNKECYNVFNKIGFSTSGRLKSWIKVKNAYKDALLLQFVFPG